MKKRDKFTYKKLVIEIPHDVSVIELQHPSGETEELEVDFGEEEEEKEK